MATLTVKTLTEDDGVIPFVAASAGGDKFAATNNARIVVDNRSAGQRTVTITSEITPGQKGIAASDWAVTVETTEILEIMPTGGQWDTFKKAADGLVTFTLDAEASVTVAVVKR